jgi:predicted nucleotidyltransferase
MLSQIRAHVNAVDPNATVILYGSRARGDERSDSDWDLLILTKSEAGVDTERRFRDQLYDLELETGEAFSIFVYSKDEWANHQSVTPFYQHVVKEGIKV